MRTTIPALITILAIALTATAQETPCPLTTSPADLTTSPTDTQGLTVGAWGSTAYVVNDVCDLADSCLWSTWVYIENNGVPGLQRNDLTHDDTCGGEYMADAIVF